MQSTNHDGERLVVIADREMTEQEVDRLADHPARITTVAAAEDLRAYYENAVSSIAAQVATERLTEAEPDTNWMRRAIYAKLFKLQRLDRVTQRLDELENGSAVRPRRYAEQAAEVVAALTDSERQKTERARLGLEAAKIAAQRRAANVAESKTRDRLFIRAAQELLPSELYVKLWDRVEELAAESKDEDGSRSA
jgi:hypothetical protein